MATVVVLTVVALLIWTSEPRYDGRSLTDWAIQAQDYENLALTDKPDYLAASNAIHQMGPAAAKPERCSWIAAASVFRVSAPTPSLSQRERGTWLAAIVAKRQRWLDRTGSQSTHRLGLGALSLSLRERAGVGVRRPMRPPSGAMAQRWQTTANRRAGADGPAGESWPDCIVPA